MQFGIRWEGSTTSETVTRMCPNGTGSYGDYITGST